MYIYVSKISNITLEEKCLPCVCLLWLQEADGGSGAAVKVNPAQLSSEVATLQKQVGRTPSSAALQALLPAVVVSLFVVESCVG